MTSKVDLPSCNGHQGIYFRKQYVFDNYAVSEAELLLLKSAWRPETKVFYAIPVDDKMYSVFLYRFADSEWMIVLIEPSLQASFRLANAYKSAIFIRDSLDLIQLHPVQ